MDKLMPIGIQDFKSLRRSGYLYVDKTRWIYPLLAEGYREETKFPPYFLSRPRRFGKSLLLSTIRYLFEGEKELFEGLWIYDKWDWGKRYPVILLSMPECKGREELEVLLKDKLRLICEKEKVLTSTEHPSSLFAELIQKLAEKYSCKVVVLIDEYDRPILDNIDEPEKAKEVREYLKGFYSLLKDLDEYLKFILLTGVTRFSKAGIFSGLNNLEDISLNPDFGNIVGITQEELEEYLGEEIKRHNVDLEEVKEWYNGYSFLGDRLYNPFDILRFVKNKCVFKDYWFSSGTPNFLIKLIESGNFYIPELSNLVVGEEMMDRFDVENLRPEVVLYQAGYLTIDEVMRSPRGGMLYRLRVPNKEVRMSLSDAILDYWRVVEKNRRGELEDGLYVALGSGDVEGIKNLVKRLFESIPYHYHINNPMGQYEGYYASVLFSFFMSTGYEVRGEDVSRRGRADIVVLAKDKVYVVEIKTDAQEPAIKQIEERRYWKKYEGVGKEIYLVGINVDSKERGIKEMEIRRV